MIRALILRLSTLVLASHCATAQCELQKLTASSAEAIDFGFSVSLSGEFAVVGSPLDTTLELYAGAAYVFRSTPSGWVELGQLLGDDIGSDEQERFGDSVAISGNTILIGAPRDNITGAAFVFEYDGQTWNQTAKLTPSGSGTDILLFGTSVALDGDRAVIGAWGGNGGAGAAYVFERSGSAWTETVELAASDGELGDYFGFSVSLSGGLALVGAYGHDDHAGAVYVFDQAMGWAEVVKIAAVDSMPFDRFGSSLAISGQTAVIGAWGEDTMGSGAGATYVFERDVSTWTQEAKLLAGDGDQDDAFGRSVDTDGETIVVGAYADFTGSAYVFHESAGGWTHKAKLTASDGVGGDLFGMSVALAGDVILTGATLASGPNGDLGAAYVHQVPSFVTPYCFGTPCPCGNDDPVRGGCANSVPGQDSNPQGALLAACGSASVADDDLVLTLSHLTPNKFGLFFMGAGQTQLPFGDGLRCVDTGGIGLFRYNPPQHSGSSGTMTLGPGIVTRSESFAMNGHIDAGETWYFQGWYRDPLGPCGTAFNLSNGLAVTFGP